MIFFIKNFKEIIDHPILSLSTIGNIFLIESILSIDNATMIAIMVKKLKEEDRKKVMKYGIIGAYFFRGICILFTSVLIKIWWLKTIGGFYLIFIGIQHLFFGEKDKKYFQKKNSFFRVLFLVEMVDLAFSIDNVFASLALSNNILFILFGSFMGIFSMRLISKFIIKLIDQCPEFNYAVFFIIIVLGFKLILASLKINLPILEQYSQNKIFKEILFSLLIFLFLFFSIFISWIKKIRK